MSRVTVLDAEDTRAWRYPDAGNHTLPLLEHIYVEFGDKSDWDALSELHYKGHNLAAGSRYMRCVYDKDGERRTIGVMVFANPMPLNKGRNEVFPHLKPNQSGGRDTTIMNKRRMQEINRFLAWNNRTVLDTMFRSAGIAYRFKNIAYRMYCAKHGFRFVESNSSMGRFNPFSIKTGMKFIKPRPANALEVGIDFFKAHFQSHPCDQVALMNELRTMPEGVREVTERKMREFYYKNSAMEKSGDKMHIGMSRVNGLAIEKVLKEVTQIVFGATIYWVWKNPDIGMQFPDRVPLLAFDNQAVDEPFRLDKIQEVIE
ncbi:hypothetical protein LJC19_04795 [Oxalobacter sp. OttesenSCG-928-P03]|nr:hypothetical protein [Oxalobacter sp. OttesenSCG-928-P03]